LSIATIIAVAITSSVIIKVVAANFS